MKKITLLTIGLFLAAQSSNLIAGNFTDLNLQTKKTDSGDDGIKGKIMFSGGVGFNLMGPALALKYQLSSVWSNENYESIQPKESPMFNLGVDYGLSDKFSAGVAFGYQTAKMILGAYQYNNNTGMSDIITSTDSWKRIHFAVKGDYHIIAKKNLSLYTGIKIGYNHYTMTSTTTQYDPTYTSRLNVTPSPVSLQAHFGLNYYFNGMIGFNAEVGIGYGGPYIFAAGLAVKI
ncbi:MAG: hypothetical protein JWP12_2122 [Bacteroidetes bacterium]|nr:hypothetical protein [Bacteroidota bacterium]